MKVNINQKRLTTLKKPQKQLILVTLWFEECSQELFM